MTFKEQLVITILDKAVISIMLAIGAYLFNRSLERFKSEQSLSNEFTKQRLVKIGEL